MSKQAQWRRIALDKILVNGDPEPAYLPLTDARLLEALPPESREWLPWLRPILVTQEDDQTYHLQGGRVTYQALRAFSNPKDSVWVVLLSEAAPTEVVEALEWLALPAAEGAGGAPKVRGRWIAAVDDRPELLRLVGLDSASFKSVARHLGVTPQTLVNDRRGRKGNDEQ